MNIKLINENELTRRNQKYTEEELLDIQRQFEKENGRPATVNDFKNNPKYPDPETYRIRFGSWNKALEKSLNIKRGKYEKYTDDELLNPPMEFEKENGRPPTTRDFTNNSKYPSVVAYQKRYGSWSNMLKMIGLDLDTIVKNGSIETNNQKGRLAEISVIKHFVQQPIDLAGENHCNPYDGICPNGLIYEVKSSSLHKIGNYCEFGIRSRKDKEIEEIEIYYLLVFNGDYTELLYVWRIPTLNIIHRDTLYIGLNPLSHAEFTIKNMKEYDITENIREVLKL
jgi:hypothetical protein